MGIIVKLPLVEEIKCKILNVVLEVELRACFDLSYRNDMTHQERKEGFMAVANDFINKYEIKDFIYDYGLDYFMDLGIITPSELVYLVENKIIESNNL